MKVWRSHRFAAKHYRVFQFSVYADRNAAWMDVTLGRHNWAVEVEW